MSYTSVSWSDVLVVNDSAPVCSAISPRTSVDAPRRHAGGGRGARRRSGRLADRHRVHRDAEFRGPRGGSLRRDRAAGVPAVAQQDDGGGPVTVASVRLDRIERRRETVADHRSGSRVDGRAIPSAAATRDRSDVGSDRHRARDRERREPHAEPGGEPVEERRRRDLCRREPVRLDVGRPHRMRHVDREHDRPGGHLLGRCAPVRTRTAGSRSLRRRARPGAVCATAAPDASRAASAGDEPRSRRSPRPRTYATAPATRINSAGNHTDDIVT